jgi:hypothetical protein
MSHRSVYCIAASHARAHRILSRLGEIAFPNTEISLLFLDLETAATARTGQASPNGRMGKKSPSAYPELGETATPQIVAVAGVGPLVAIGPVAAILSDAATYGIAGGLREFGVPSSEATHYEARLKEGHVFLAIRTENPDKSDRVREIFAAEGAEDIRTLMHVITPKTSRKSLYGNARLVTR